MSLLRRALHPDFEGHSGSKYRALQQKGLNMMTTFALDAEKGKVSFCLDRTVWDEMQRGEKWHFGLWGTDA